jgi:nucleobase:cation symporter-1, NCS1 family
VLRGLAKGGATDGMRPTRSTSPAWHVERRGLEAVPLADRRGGVRGVVAVWFAGNLAITSVVVGAVVASYGLSVWQGLFALLGVSSFLIVGYFGLPGMRTGRPTMALSEASFGSWGNVGPSALSWFNLVGWETVALVIAAYALAAAYDAAFNATSSPGGLVVALAVVAALAFSVAFMGHAAIVWVQSIFACLFGVLTVVVVALLVPTIHWHALLGAHGGPWLTGVVPALSIVIAASGLSWVNTASDYTRYLRSDTPAWRLVWATALGAAIPVLLLMALGMVLASEAPSLASTTNPIGALQTMLPTWVRVLYLLTAVGGMVTGDILDIYSAGLSLLAARVRLPRSRTVLIDAAVSLSASLYVLLVARNVTGTFEAFLGVIACFLAPWTAIFLLDSRSSLRSGYSEQTHTSRWRWQACAAWLVGTAVALAFTSTGVLSGPLAVGVFRGSSLGYLVGFFVTLGLYGGLQMPARQRERRGESERAASAAGQREDRRQTPGHPGRPATPRSDG